MTLTPFFTLYIKESSKEVKVTLGSLYNLCSVQSRLSMQTFTNFQTSSLISSAETF